MTYGSDECRCGMPKDPRDFCCIGCRRTPEEKSESLRRSMKLAWSELSYDERMKRTKNGRESIRAMTLEQRSAAALKSWETRRAKAAAAKP